MKSTLSPQCNITKLWWSLKLKNTCSTCCWHGAPQSAQSLAYRLDDLVTKFLSGSKEFPLLQMFRQALGTGHPPSLLYNVYWKLCSWEQCGLDMKLTTHLHLVPRSRVSAATPVLCPVYPQSMQRGQLYPLLYNHGPGCEGGGHDHNDRASITFHELLEESFLSLLEPWNVTCNFLNEIFKCSTITQSTECTYLSFPRNWQSLSQSRNSPLVKELNS